MDTVTSMDAKRTTTLERKPTTAWPPTRASTPSPAKKNYKSLPSLFSNFLTVNLCIFWQIEVISWPIFSTASCETLKLASSLLSQLTYASLRNWDYGTELNLCRKFRRKKFHICILNTKNEPVFGSLSVIENENTKQQVFKQTKKQYQNWIQMQKGPWIRIPNFDPDPGREK